MIQINKRKVGVCILFSLLTFGVYLIYWKYLTIKNTKAINEINTKNAGELLCLLFVPFYSLFWWYTRGKTVKAAFTDKGYTALGNEILYLLLDLFWLDIVAISIMQNDFNQIPSDRVICVYKAAKTTRVITGIISTIYIIIVASILLLISIVGILRFRMNTSKEIVSVLGYIPFNVLTDSMNPPTAAEFEPMYPIVMTFNAGNNAIKNGLTVKAENVTINRTADADKLLLTVGNKRQYVRKIASGDLILIKKVRPENIEIGDVIAFFDPEAGGSAVVTHRVIALEYDEKSGDLVSFRTRGDNNSSQDLTSVPTEKIVGKWTGIIYSGLGSIAVYGTFAKTDY